MQQPTKEQLRGMVQRSLSQIVKEMNLALSGKTIRSYKDILTRLGRHSNLPHWYAHLTETNTLPNLDGKTVGSIVEMIFVAVLEKRFLNHLSTPLKINPARGVDLPDLDLGIKSPSENYCTSEPFFTAYERLMGSENDAVILLTDYQTAKKNPPLKLQIINSAYLSHTEIADRNLCAIGKNNRDWLLEINDSLAQKMFRFLAFVNQSDWRARALLFLMSLLRDDDAIAEALENIKNDFESKNKKLLAKSSSILAESELEKLISILDVSPRYLGVINAADDWVIENLKDAGRFPNENEWNRIKSSPLDGKIGMSFALQWRYNFGKIFGVNVDEVVDQIKLEDAIAEN